jgi:hypothetical protein
MTSRAIQDNDVQKRWLRQKIDHNLKDRSCDTVSVATRRMISVSRSIYWKITVPLVALLLFASCGFYVIDSTRTIRSTS